MTTSENLLEEARKEFEAGIASIPEAKEWFDTRPEIVKAAILKRPPTIPYQLKDQEHAYYYIKSWGEEKDGSVTVTCYKDVPEFPFMGGYGVFGIKIDDLIPAEIEERGDKQ